MSDSDYSVYVLSNALLSALSPFTDDFAKPKGFADYLPVKLNIASFRIHRDCQRSLAC
jgi:hypothetical protein